MALVSKPKLTPKFPSRPISNAYPNRRSESIGLLRLSCALASWNDPDSNPEIHSLIPMDHCQFNAGKLSNCINYSNRNENSHESDLSMSMVSNTCTTFAGVKCARDVG